MYITNLHRVSLVLFGKTGSFDYGSRADNCSSSAVTVTGGQTTIHPWTDRPDRQTDGDIDWSLQQIMVELIIRQW